MNIFDLYLPLILIVPPAIVVILLIALVRRRPGDEPDMGIGIARRIFYYVVSFAALMMAAIGADGLLQALIEAAPTEQGRLNAESVAFGLAALIVALPIWLLVRRLADRSLTEHPAEAGSLSRKLYVYGALAVALAFITVALYSIVGSAVSPNSFEPYTLTTFAVWMSVATYHWRRESSEGQPSPNSRGVRSIFIYSASLLGLTLLLVGAWMISAAAMRGAYDAIFAAEFDFDATPLRIGMGLAVPGALYWTLFWHRWSQADAESPLRIAFIYGGIFSGTAIAVVSGAVALQQIVEWALQPHAIAPSERFNVLPLAAAGLFVGLANLAYHAALADALPNEFIASGKRLYRYLLSAVGLFTLSLGAVVLVASAIGALTNSSGPDGDLEASAAITMLSLGAPLWAYQWARQQATARTAPADELTASSRRYFVYIVFGASLLVGAGALTAIIFMAIFAALDGGLANVNMDDMRWGIANLLIALAVGGYYRLGVRVEQPTPAEGNPAVIQKRVIVAASDGSTANAIAGALGYRVRFWRINAPVALLDIATAVRAVTSAPADNVLIVIDEKGTSVIPYNEE